MGVGGFGRRLEQARLAKRWQQSELGSKVGVDQSVISKWETEQRMPRASAFRNLAAQLDVDWRWLRYGDPQPITQQARIALGAVPLEELQQELARRGLVAVALPSVLL